jgi:hypothetical protein
VLRFLLTSYLLWSIIHVKCKTLRDVYLSAGSPAERWRKGVRARFMVRTWNVRVASRHRGFESLPFRTGTSNPDHDTLHTRVWLFSSTRVGSTLFAVFSWRKTCRYGEIGRHTSLRGLRTVVHPGSSPGSGIRPTSSMEVYSFLRSSLASKNNEKDLCLLAKGAMLVSMIRKRGHMSFE